MGGPFTGQHLSLPPEFQFVHFLTATITSHDLSTAIRPSSPTCTHAFLVQSIWQLCLIKEPWNLDLLYKTHYVRGPARLLQPYPRAPSL